MKKIMTAALALGLAAVSQMSIAQGAPTFESLDTSKDGKLDKKEVSAWFDLIKGYGINVGPDAESFLKNIDKNGDGNIDKAEFDLLPKSA